MTTIATWIGYAVLAYLAFVAVLWVIFLIKNHWEHAAFLLFFSPFIAFRKIKESFK